MKKLVIFDLDGTLLNTIADLAQAANYALQSLGFPVHEEEKYYSFVGNGINKLLERALPQGQKNAENIQKMRALFVPYYDEHNTEFTCPYAGIEALLQQLQQQGLKLAIASNKYQSATEKLVRHYFPHISFVAIVGQREGIPVKPDPLFLKEILDLVRLPKQDILYVGDSDVDIQTAHNTQIDVCAVTWGFRSRKELMENGPAFLVDKASDILTVLR